MTINKLYRCNKAISLFLIISMVLSVLVVIDTTPVKAAGTLSVNFGVDKGPVTHRYTGFLHSITSTDPSDSLITALHPQTWRTGFFSASTAYPDYGVQNIYSRLMGLGVQEVQILVYTRCTLDAPPGETWADCAADVVNYAIAHSWNNAVFEPLNEPDLYANWGYPADWYNQVYIPIYRKIRALKPNAVIVGPSYSNYNYAVLNSFLDQAKIDNVVPDILSWHFSDPRNVQANVNSIKSLLSSKGLSNVKISINEIIGPNGDTGKVDLPVFYLAQAERAQIDSIMHACWDDMGDGTTGAHPVLDGIITYPGLKTRAPYWVYKYYGDMTGRMVNVTPADGGTGNTGLDGLASSDSATNTARVLFAGDSGNGTVVFNNMSSASYLGNNVNVKVEYVTTNGNAVSNGPSLLSQQVYTVSNNQLIVNLSGLNVNSAYMVTLTPSANTTTTTVDQSDPSVTFNGSWTLETGATGSVGGSDKYSTTAGAYAQFSFTGTSIQLIARTNQWSGSADIYIDGTFQSTVSMYSAIQQFQVPVYTKSSLSSGSHTIKVVVNGANGPGGYNAADVDAFVYTPTSSGTIVDQTDPSVTFSGFWTLETGATGSVGGSDKYSTTGGAYAQFSFTGTSIQLIARTNQWSGSADIYIDGTFQSTVSMYSAIQQFQVPVYTKSSLSSGSHTIKVVVNGANGPGGYNAADVDAFVYH